MCEREREREREAKEHSRDIESWVPHADITILALGQSDGVGLPGWAEVIAGDVTTKSGVGSQFNYKQNIFLFYGKEKAYTQTKTAFPTRNHNSSTGTAARQPERVVALATSGKHEGKTVRYPILGWCLAGETVKHSV